VKLEDVNAEKVDASTSNGKVLLRTSASDVRAQSSNGRIVVVPLGTAGGDARYELATSNGSVRMQCSAEPDTGFLLDLHTSNGKIETEMPDLEYELNEKHHGRRSVKAKTRGFDSMSNRIRIQARTSNGKIVVGSPVDWE